MTIVSERDLRKPRTSSGSCMRSRLRVCATMRTARTRRDLEGSWARKFRQLAAVGALRFRLDLIIPRLVRHFTSRYMATFVDPSASTSTTVTLRKRKRRDSLVIHLSSPSPSCDNDLAYTESEHDPSYISDAPEVITRERPPKCRKRYACSYDGCTKSYTKPSRLEEHERSHTGTVSPTSSVGG